MAKLDFNKSPYFDDFAAVKGSNYRRILFRPSFAVQARELTQLQTNLQEQLKDITNATLDSGNQLIPGELTVLTDVQQIILADTNTASSFLGTYHTDSKSTLTDKYVIGMDVQNSDGTKVGKIIASRPPSGDETETSIFVIPKTGTVFGASEDLFETGSTSSDKLATTATIGKATLACLGAGTYYINGFALEVASQIIILEDGYSDVSTLNYQIGLTVTESIVDELIDGSLEDPALKNELATNVSAAGATRYKLAVALSSKKFNKNLVDITKNEGFIEIARLIDGKLQKKVSYQDSIATKDYVTDIVSRTEEPFTITVEDDIDNSVKLKVTSGSKIVDGKKITVRQANEFTLSGSTGIETTTDLIESGTSLWGGASVHTESGLRVVTKGGITLAGTSAGGWPHFAPPTNYIENNRVVLAKKIGSDYKSIGSARIENITLAENITKIRLSGGDIDQYNDLTPGEFLSQTYSSSSDSGFKAKFISAEVDDAGKIVLNVQVHFGSIATASPLQKADGTTAVPASLLDAPATADTIGNTTMKAFTGTDLTNYSWIPTQAEFEIGLNDIQLDKNEIAVLKIDINTSNLDSVDAGDKVSITDPMGAPIEGTVVSKSSNEIIVKDMTGKFIPCRGKFSLDGSANTEIDITSVTYEPPINPYTIADVTHLLKYTSTDSRRSLTDSTVICQLDSTNLYGAPVSSDETYPVASAVDRMKTRELGEFSNPRLYKIGNSVKTAGNVSITKIRQTFVEPASNSGANITVNLRENFTFDTTEPVLLWSSSLNNGGFVNPSQYKYTFKDGNTTLELKSIVNAINLPYIEQVHSTQNSADANGVATGQKTLPTLAISTANTFYVVATVNKTKGNAGEKTLYAHSEYITDQLISRSSEILLQKMDIIPYNFRVYEISKDSTNNTTWPDATPTVSELSSRGFDISDRYTLDGGQEDSYYRQGTLKLKTGEEAPGGPIWVAYYYFAPGTGDYFDASSYPIGQTIDQGSHFPETVNWVSKLDNKSSTFEYDDIPTYKGTNGVTYRLSDCIDARGYISSNSYTMVSPSSFVSFGGNVTVTNLTKYAEKNSVLSLETDGTVKLLEGPKDSRVQDFVLSDVDSVYAESVSDGVKLADIKINGYLHDKTSVSLNPIETASEQDDIILSDAIDPIDIFRDPLDGDITHTEYSVAKDGDKIRPSFTKKHVTFDNTSLQVADGLYTGETLATLKANQLVTFPENDTTATEIEIENSDYDGSLPIRYSEPGVYYGVMQISPSQFLGKSSRKYIGNTWKSWESEADDTIASKKITVTVDGLRPICDGITVKFDGKDATPNAVATTGGSTYTSTTTLKTDKDGKLVFDYRIPNINDGYVTLKLQKDVSDTVTVTDIVKQKRIHHTTPTTQTGGGITGWLDQSNEYVVSSGTVSFVQAGADGFTYIGLTNVVGDFAPTGYVTENSTNSGLLREDGQPIAGVILDHAEGSSFKCGSKLIEISSNDGTTKAEGYFYGTDVVHTNLATRNLDHNIKEQGETSLFQEIEILSDCFAKSIDLGFSAIHTLSTSSATNYLDIPKVIVQIREITDGLPSNKALPFSTVAKTVTIVTASAGWENFEFSDYVYLKKGKYAISISSSSTEYTLQTLNVDSGNGTRPLAIGKLYQGDYVNPSDILRFRLQRVLFDDPSNKSITLQSSGDANWGTVDNALLLLEDSISSTVNSGQMTIKIPGHGFKVGDTIMLSGLVGRPEITYTLTGSPNVNLSSDFPNNIVYSTDINSQSPGYSVNDIKGPWGYGISYDTTNQLFIVAMMHGQFADGSSLAFLDGAGPPNTLQGTVGTGNTSSSTIKYVNGVDIAQLNNQAKTIDSITANTITIGLGGTNRTRRSGIAQGTYGATLIENSSNQGPAYKNDLYYVNAGFITPDDTRVSWLQNDATIEQIWPNRLVQTLGFSRYISDINLVPTLAHKSGTDYKTSPVIDKGMISFLAISNIIDNSGTSANYISKTINTGKSANSIEVILDSSLPGVTSLSVYAKINSPNAISSDAWTELKPVGSLKMGDATNTFFGKELGDFTNYQIKVSLKATDSSNVPVIKNLRYVSSLQGKTTKTLKSSTVKIVQACRYLTEGTHAQLGITDYSSSAEFTGLLRDTRFATNGWYEIDVPTDFNVEDAAAIVEKVNDNFSIAAVDSSEGPITGTITVTNDNTGGSTSGGGWSTGTTFTVTPPTSRGTWRSPATFTIATVDTDLNVATLTITSAGDGFIANETAKWDDTHDGYTQNVIGLNGAGASDSVIALATGSLAPDGFDNEVYPRFTINTVNAAAHDVTGISGDPVSTHVAEAKVKRLEDGTLFPSRLGNGIVLQVRLVKDAHLFGVRSRTIASSAITANTMVYPEADVSTLVILKGR